MIYTTNSRLISGVILLFVILSNPLTSFSQSSISNVGETGNSKSVKSDEPVIIPNTAVLQENQNITDEYGEMGYNGYLAGLNGASNFVQVSSNSVFNQNFDGSMEMWIYPLSLSAVRQLIGKGASSNVQFIWGLNGNLQYFRIGTNVALNNAGFGIPVNQWTHVAVTWTGGNPFTIKFYVNGALSGSPQVIGNSWLPNSDVIKIGGPSGGFSSELFNGYIDEVRFWDPERTASEIRDNRFVGVGDGVNSNSSGAIVSSTAYTGLIASWNFNKTALTVTDYINGYSGVYTGSSYSQQTLAGNPIPYNFALKCPGTGGTSRVNIPYNSSFDQYTDGTMEAWVYTTVNNQIKEIVAKGNSVGVSYIFGMSNNGKLYARFGNIATINNDGITIPVNQWTHVAWVWLNSGGIFNVRFYVNGQLSGTPLNNSGVFNINTDPMTIGSGIAFPSESWSGFIDEVRFWSDQKSMAQIRANMFGSARGLTSTSGLIGAWNFDGNLLNRSALTGINGTFNTGGTNDCRLSGFINETSSGAMGNNFVSHTTVVHRAGSGFPFPGGFGIRVPYKPILDNQTTRDTIFFTGSATIVTAVEVFLSVRHTWVGDLNITLRAPNGQTRDLTSGNGAGGDNILTFFVDGSTSVTSPQFLAPWSNLCASEQTLGTFGGSPTNGAWILEVADIATGDIGSLQGWGIRLNNNITGTETPSVIPVKFALYQNYPNPFNPVTNIRFDIPKDVNVKLSVYDILGKEITTLINAYTKAGEYNIQFDAVNISSGAYFYKLEAGNYTDVKKLIIIK